MQWRLALDMGTNSIGWAVFEIDTAGNPYRYIDGGVRIFHDGREPSKADRVGESLSVNRRTARGMRRNHDRRKNRKKQLLSELQSVGLLPKSSDELTKLFRQNRRVDKSQPLELHLQHNNPYYRRYLAINGTISPNDLGMALYHLGMRRGFKSNRMADGGDETEFKKKIAKFKETVGDKTLGEYLWFNYIDNPTVNFYQNVNPNAKQGQGIGGKIRFSEGAEFYPDRSMYQNEFDRIKDKQHHHLSDEQWDKIAHIIFYQNPLKPVEKGKCTFEPLEERSHADLPTAQKFRILQEVSNLRYLDDNNTEHSLSPEQRSAIIDKLATNKTVSFDAMRKLKGENKIALFPKTAIFTIEQSGRDKLHGATTNYDMNKFLSDSWGRLSSTEKDDFIEFLHTEAEEDTVLQKLDAMGCENEDAIKFVLSFTKPKTMNLSRKAMENIIPFMEQGYRYDESVQMAGYGHHSYFDDGDILPYLPYYGEILNKSTVKPLETPTTNKNELEFGKIGNPTVHVALNQLRKLVNALIKQYNNPHDIHLEINRDLKLPKSKRDEITADNKNRAKKNKAIEKKYQEEFGENYELNALDRKKYILWEELSSGMAHNCVYCGKSIGFGKLCNGDAEIEHILPYSKTLDDSMANLTLSHNTCNRDKKNRTPHQAFSNHKDTKYNWDDIMANAGVLPPNKRWRFAEDAMEKFNEKCEQSGGFIQRQLNDTAYISRATKEYLTPIVGASSKVLVNSGKMTALIRGKLGVSKLLSNDNQPEKNRDDHRHHAIDAFVIGLITPQFIQQISKQSGADDPEYDGRINIPEITDEMREQLQKKLANMVISYKQDHGIISKFFKDTAYGAVDEKQNDGYNLVTRKALSSLSKNEIFAIRDSLIQSRVIEFIQHHDNGIPEVKSAKDLKPIEKRLEGILADFSNKHGIHRVRILAKGQTAIKIEHTENHNNKKHHKLYAPEEYIFCDIYKTPKINKAGKFTGKFEYKGAYRSSIEFLQIENQKKQGENVSLPKPHPSAKHLMRLYKNDIVQITKDGEIIQMRVAGFSTTNNNLDLRPMMESNSSRRFFAIPGLITNENMQKITVTVDGKVK